MSLAFNKTISVFAANTGTDGRGFPTKDWNSAPATTPVASGIPASIQQMSSRQIEVFGRRGLDADIEIFTKGDPKAKKGMRIPDPDASGVYYTVVDTEDMGGRGRFFSIACKRVK